MMFATGDTHVDFRRFSKSIFFEQDKLTKNDYVIVCGDFGIWDNSSREKYWLDWLDEKPFTTLFAAGNHSNYELLATYPTIVRSITWYPTVALQAFMTLSVRDYISRTL